jgi:large subunit ribosomal protein L6
MSRIGRLPVKIPKGVTVTVADGGIQVKGPKGQLSRPLAERISARVEGEAVHFDREGDDKVARANHGLMRALTNNMVTGVTQGFQKVLQIEGTGFRAEVRGKNLSLLLGYSHPIDYAIPEGITITVDKQTRVLVNGIDRQQVGQVAANIRAFRKPDSYKGKGIRYEGEVLRLKEGKSA